MSHWYVAKAILRLRVVAGGAKNEVTMIKKLKHHNHVRLMWCLGPWR
jgi:hypothetical protein